MTIGIIDYGAGNTKSVINALERLRIPNVLTDNLEVLSTVDKIILPGVGNARRAMEELTQRNLVDFLVNFDRNLLGICLGMQLLASFSEEENTTCLDIIESKVIRFSKELVKVPKVGWNITNNQAHPLFAGIKNDNFFYYVHSYFMPKNPNTIATTSYGISYSAAIQKNQFFGVQFHPEKSGENGLQLLKNFAEL